MYNIIEEIAQVKNEREEISKINLERLNQLIFKLRMSGLELHQYSEINYSIKEVEEMIMNIEDSNIEKYRTLCLFGICNKWSTDYEETIREYRKELIEKLSYNEIFLSTETYTNIVYDTTLKINSMKDLENELENNYEMFFSDRTQVFYKKWEVIDIKKSSNVSYKTIVSYYEKNEFRELNLTINNYNNKIEYFDFGKLVD